MITTWDNEQAKTKVVGGQARSQSNKKVTTSILINLSSIVNTKVASPM